MPGIFPCTTTFYRRTMAGCALVLAGLVVAPSLAVAAPIAAATTKARLSRETVRYRLGPGDRLVMSVFKMKGYEADVEVLSDGTINLPRIGTVEVWGLTLEQARQRITSRYEQFLRRPLVYLDLASSRPVKVTVTGQVVRPGVFSLPSTTELGWPTLVDVVQQAGGVTALGDLSRIEVLRPSSVPGALPRIQRYDYLSVLRNGGLLALLNTALGSKLIRVTVDWPVLSTRINSTLLSLPRRVMPPDIRIAWESGALEGTC